MRHPLLNVMVLVVLSVSSSGAGAQQIYRCGDSYSQTPCPDGIVIDATDGRTKAQKTQADLATERAERAAAALEKARLQQEKATATHAPKVKAKASAPASKKRNSQAKKKKESEYFTVRIPGKKTAKKSTAKQETN
jgi:hypothetical protein